MVAYIHLTVTAAKEDVRLLYLNLNRYFRLLWWKSGDSTCSSHHHHHHHCLIISRSDHGISEVATA